MMQKPKQKVTPITPQKFGLILVGALVLYMVAFFVVARRLPLDMMIIPFNYYSSNTFPYTVIADMQLRTMSLMIALLLSSSVISAYLWINRHVGGKTLAFLLFLAFITIGINTFGALVSLDMIQKEFQPIEELKEDDSKLILYREKRGAILWQLLFARCKDDFCTLLEWETAPEHLDGSPQIIWGSATDIQVQLTANGNILLELFDSDQYHTICLSRDASPNSLQWIASENAPDDYPQITCP